MHKEQIKPGFDNVDVIGMVQDQSIIITNKLTAPRFKSKRPSFMVDARGAKRIPRSLDEEIGKNLHRRHLK